MVIELLSVRSVNSRAHILLLFCQEHPRTHTQTLTVTHTRLSAHAPRRVCVRAHSAQLAQRFRSLWKLLDHGSNAQRKVRGEFTPAQFVSSKSPVCLWRCEFAAGGLMGQHYDFSFTVHRVTSLRLILDAAPPQARRGTRCSKSSVCLTKCSATQNSE